MYPNTGSSGSSDIPWDELYPSLRALARYLVNDFKVPSWRGQEYDVIEDIVQETMRRLIERARKAERGEAPPIQSLQQMMMVIANNYYRDLKRRDRRLARMASNTGEHALSSDSLDPSSQTTAAFDLAVEKVYQEQLFTVLAHEIKDFPARQRAALLTDLANRMSFDTRPTPLQSAFLSEGLQLQQYRQSLPASPKERSRHISLLSHAYRRVAHLPDIAKEEP
ncbi:MAG TPA: hypothetical protein VKR06_05325 [Ktedonosporobacter sp.]|nr:hypothetical protein [Ktedonosporobacter sp.]